MPFEYWSRSGPEHCQLHLRCLDGVLRLPESVESGARRLRELLLLRTVIVGIRVQLSELNEIFSAKLVTAATLCSLEP